MSRHRRQVDIANEVLTLISDFSELHHEHLVHLNIVSVVYPLSPLNFKSLLIYVCMAI